jgi:hypothetical protein
MPYKKPVGFNANDSVEFVLGLVEGLGVEYDYSDCIQDVETIVTDLVNGFHSAEQHNFQDFFSALGNAFDTINAALSVCKQIEELEKVIDEFKHPKDLVYHAGKALLFHGKEVLGEVDASVTAWKSGDYRAAGKAVGEIVGVLTNAPAPVLSEAEILEMTTSQLVDLIEGILIGIGETDAHDFDSCLTDVESIWSDLESAYDSITADDVSDFFTYLGRALVQIKAAFSDCGSTVSELEAAVEIFTGGWLHILWEAAKSLVLNGHQIYQYFEAARTSWDNADFKDCGIAIGDIIATVV